MTGPSKKRDQLEVLWIDPLDANVPIGDWQALACEAVDPNPFFSPSFLQPYLEAFPYGKVRLAVVREISTRKWLLAAPVGRRCAGLMVPVTSVWTSYYSPLGMPLAGPEAGSDTFGLFLDAVCGASRSLALPFLPRDSRAADMLVHLDGWSARWAALGERAGHGAGALGARQLEEGFRGKRRKEMRRQLRRLEDHGSLSIRHLEGEDVIAGFDAFLELEARGWKGRTGTALSKTPEIMKFAKDLIQNRSRQNGVRIDQIWAGDRLVAALVLFLEKGRVFSWKIASDEAFAKYSPGAQIAVIAMKQNLDLPDFYSADSLAVPGHTMIEPLWRGRIEVGTLLMSKGAVGATVAALAAADFELSDTLREKVRFFRSSHQFKSASSRA